MYIIDELILDFDKFRSYMDSLKGIGEELASRPIAQGKWSIAEIVSHLMFWDRYIREEILSLMKQDANIVSIDIQTLNDRAAEYARSGVTFQRIIDHQIKERKQLVTELKGKTEEEWFASFTLNGEEIDPHSGYPHNMFNYFCGFVWHDNHHKKQIESFLAKINVKL